MTREERRKSRRVAARIAMRVRQAADAARRSLKAHSINLSSGGIYCRIPAFLPPLTRVTLSFELPGLPDGPGRSISCNGVIVRCERFTDEKGYQAACCFTDLSEEDKEFIEDFVTRQMLLTLASEART
jgi:c-di-GMP-binding flagellar brake protein YcgR